ncbi:MAG TPA: PDZ domain-containing protein, partial [Anaeromyxobacteraceae bacterium]|nr:PDZ domain-containing protein [Anaeromyxobacteraceae bacterium]
FRVAAGGAAVALVRYGVFAHELTVRTSHLDGTHGFINGTSVFMYAEGREREAHLLEVIAPAGWRVACALNPAAGAGRDPFVDRAETPGERWLFAARDYDELVDSPLEVGTHELVPFDALGKGHAIALWGMGGVDLVHLAQDVRCIVEHFGALMGGLPYARYLFIVHLSAGTRGGLEHASSSTILLRRGDLSSRGPYQDALQLFAHEFFHVWNVKGLRPAAFVPLNYTREQYTRLLWWFEGVTSYYGELALVRMHLADPKRYFRHLGEELTALSRLPGTAKMSLEEASLIAWVKHYRPDENTPNSAVSYYRKGELVALALDLALRRAGSSLDEVVRAVCARYTARGLPEDGIECVVAETLGPEPSRAFFEQYVRGTGMVGPSLEDVGLRIGWRRMQGFDDKGGTPPKPDSSAQPGWIGAAFASGPRFIVMSVSEEGPAWRAGLYAGDEIIAEGGLRVDRPGLWDRMCECGPGKALRLTVFRRDALLELQIPMEEAPADTAWVEPIPSPSPEQKAAFESWCGTPFPDADR